MTSLSPRSSHAVVIGGSLAGLLTARVLSNHFARVTILERDPVHEQPEARKGQPQTRHLHGLLASGFELMRRYYPELPQALLDSGALINDFAETMRWYSYGGYRKTFTLGKRAALMSRPLLEALVRKFTLALPNVELLLDEAAVLALLTTPDRQRVTGVSIQRRGLGGALQELQADLVVDCSGRGSRTPQWLPQLGYEAPPVSEVKVDVGYATRQFRRDPQAPNSRDWFLVTPEAPREHRFGGMFPVEGDRWIVSVGGWNGDHAPLDEGSFMEFVRSLPGGDIYQVISRAEPLTDIIAHKYSSSLRRHYERLSRFPQGYLVLGDALCSFNPTYGQGMTSAAMQAAELDALLGKDRGRLEGLAQRFFKRAAHIVATPWQLAVGEDFRFPETTGPKPPGVDLINRYVARVHRATRQDAEVGRAFALVMNLLAPPASLMSPAMMLRVWRANHLLDRQEKQARQAYSPSSA